MRPKDLLLKVSLRFAHVARGAPSARPHGENIATPVLSELSRVGTPKAKYVCIANCSASDILEKVNLQRADHFEGQQSTPLTRSLPRGPAPGKPVGDLSGQTTNYVLNNIGTGWP